LGEKIRSTYGKGGKRLRNTYVDVYSSHTIWGKGSQSSDKKRKGGSRPCGHRREDTFSCQRRGGVGGEIPLTVCEEVA